MEKLRCKDSNLLLLEQQLSQGDAVATEASAHPRRSSGARMALQCCPTLRSEMLCLCIYHWVQAAPRKRCNRGQDNSLLQRVIPREGTCTTIRQHSQQLGKGEIWSSRGDLGSVSLHQHWSVLLLWELIIYVERHSHRYLYFA